MSTVLKKLKTHLKHKLICQAYLISYPKCGRTWLNSILLHYLLRHYRGISEPVAFEFGHSMVKHSWYRCFPSMCFTHDVSSPAIPYREYAARFNPSQYLTKPSLLLVRDPRDVVVSRYYHAKKKVAGKKLPLAISLHDFLHHDAYGIRSIIAFYNLWSPLIRSYENVSWSRYEDLHGDPLKIVSELLAFFGVEPIDAEALEWAIEQTKFAKFQHREIEKRRMGGESTDREALRVRKGIIGAYREEMEIADIDYANRIISEELDSLFGYV